MRCGHPVPSIATLTLVFLLLHSGSATAGIVNGHFETGDLSGWTASAIDDLGNAVTPLISVDSVAGNHFALFDTGDFATGPFISTLEQTFLVSAAAPILTFDFSSLFTSSDATGTGTRSFLDAWVVSLQRGGDFFELLLLDQNGPLADPFGTAPGTVALGVPLSSGFEFTFAADLSALVGEDVTLFMDMINEDDAVRSTVQLDNVLLRAELPEKAVIREPAGWAVWALLLATAAALPWCRRRLTRRLS